MHPRQSLDTSIPVLPNFIYSMFQSSPLTKLIINMNFFNITYMFYQILFYYTIFLLFLLSIVYYLELTPSQDFLRKKSTTLIYLTSAIDSTLFLFNIVYIVFFSSSRIRQFTVWITKNTSSNSNILPINSPFF